MTKTMNFIVGAAVGVTVGLVFPKASKAIVKGTVIIFKQLGKIGNKPVKTNPDVLIPDVLDRFTEEQRAEFEALLKTDPKKS